MNKIHKNANHVLVWLGVDEAGQAESAIQLTHKLHKQFKDEAECDRLHITYMRELENQSEEEWRALDHLADLPWVSEQDFDVHSCQIISANHSSCCTVQAKLDCPGDWN